MDRIVLEQMLGEGLSLVEIGRRLDRHESTVSYWLQRHGLDANGRAFHAPRGRLRRAQLAPLVEAACSSQRSPNPLYAARPASGIGFGSTS
jgi:IS30 family transposase